MTATGDPQAVALCGCLQCRKRTGSTYSAHAFYPDAAVQVHGPHRQFRRGSDSGRHVTFHFCPDCGGTLFWKAEARPLSLGVAIGAFADPDFPAPQSAIWTEAMLRWTPLPPGIPTHPRATPPPAEAG